MIVKWPEFANYNIIAEKAINFYILIAALFLVKINKINNFSFFARKTIRRIRLTIFCYMSFNSAFCLAKYINSQIK